MHRSRWNPNSEVCDWDRVCEEQRGRDVHEVLLWSWMVAVAHPEGNHLLTPPCLTFPLLDLL